MISGVVLITFPIWPGSFNKIKVAKLLWPIFIFTIMVALNTFLVIISDLNTLQFATFTTNLITTVVLLGWRAGIPLISFGIVGMIGFYSCCTPLKEFQGNIDSPAFIVIYVFLIVGTTIMIFIKPREEEREGLTTKVGTLSHKINHYHQKMTDQEREIKRLGATAQKILNNVNHELRLPVGNVINFAEMLKNGLNEYSHEEQKMLTSEVYNNSKRLSSMILNMLDLVTLDTHKMDLDKKKVNFSELVEDRITSCRNVYLEDKPLNFEIAISQDIFLNIDPNYMRQAIDNLIINAINHTDSGTIKITLKQKENDVCFTIQDQGKGISKEDIYDIFTPFKIGKNTESKAEGRGIGLALCKTVINAHKGQIKAQSNGVKGAKFTFTMPIEL
jgi:signal transduction histidine kinase